MKIGTTPSKLNRILPISVRLIFLLSEYFYCISVGAANNVTILYPLVTHDPNMLKKKSRGNLLGKLKCLFQKEIQNFLLEIVHTSTRGLYIF